MNAKPSYEELERRIQELEIIQAEYNESKKALRENETWFKLLYEKAPLGYQSLDERGHFISVNQAWLQTMGYSSEEVIGRSFADFLHPDWRDHFMENFPRFKAIGEILGVEFEMVKKNKDLILVSFTGKINRDEKGNFQQTHCIFHDITDRKKHEELLERYKNIVSSTSDAIAYLDENYRYIIVNGAYEDFSGVKRDDFVGMTVAEYMGREIFEEKIKSNLDRCLNGEIVNYQEWFEYPSKGKRFVDVTYFPYRDGENHISGVIANTRDITERKKAEEALNRERLMLARTEAVAHVGSWEWEAENDRVTWSEELFRIFGLEPMEEAPPFNEHQAFYVPEDRKRLVEAVEECLRNNIPYDLEVRVTRTDGKLRHCVVRGIPEQGADGAVNRLYGSLHDITERKQMDANLSREHERMDNILRLTRTNIDILDSEYNLRQVDAVWEKIYGNPQGRKCYEYFKGTRAPCAGCCVPQALASRQKIITDEFLPRENRHIEVHIIPFQDENGEWLVAEFNIDITERKQAEAERERLQIQLNQAQKMESVGRLAGGVAHDFNNMLGVILGHTELALEKVAENQDLYGDLREIQTAAKRSAAITKQLLAFARKQTISPRQLDLNDTVESMLNMLRRLIGEDIDLIWKPSAHIWPVKMDPSQIDQILANLCVNARDAITGVGKITIETARKSLDEKDCREHPGGIPGDFVLLAVRDNGYGMDKNTLDNLFEPFFTTKEMGKGTGLGLATVYGIVKQNNGFIIVYSEPGQGSTFNIYLPRLVDDEDTDTAVSEKKEAAGGTETILLVEDEPTILKMTRMMLERKGYAVLPAATPGEAIDLAKTHQNKIHLLMSDVVMPEMNGRDLAETITALYPDIRRLFMSGYTADIIAHQGVIDDSVAFIQKPFPMTDLAEKVREVLDMASNKNQGCGNRHTGRGEDEHPV